MSTMQRVLTRTRVEGLVILLVAVGYIWEADNVPSFYQLPGVPGPTTFPWLLGIVFALSGLWLIVSPQQLIARFRKESSDKKPDEPPPLTAGAGIMEKIAGSWHFCTMWVIILAYLCFMPSLGFPVATALLLATFFFLLGEKRWQVVIGLALLATALIYACFALGLNVRLPLGVLEPLVKR
jgi:putative tricarboxylic transport membrane protein